MCFPHHWYRASLWKRRFHLNLYLRHARGCWLSRCWKRATLLFPDAQSTLNAMASNSRSSFPKSREFLPICNTRRFRGHSTTSSKLMRVVKRSRMDSPISRTQSSRLFPTKWTLMIRASSVSSTLRRGSVRKYSCEVTSVTLIRVCVNAHRAS